MFLDAPIAPQDECVAEPGENIGEFHGERWVPCASGAHHGGVVPVRDEMVDVVDSECGQGRRAAGPQPVAAPQVMVDERQLPAIRSPQKSARTGS